MSAFYFGPPWRQIFGYHHAPSGAERGAVVVCAPLMAEYQYAHRTLQILARRLAGLGHHVLRFDYYGTGDSGGSSVDIDLDGCVEDAARALQELRSTSGRDRIDLVGLRLGALIAARVAETSRTGRLVLWDPVLDGEGWLREVAENTHATEGYGEWMEVGATLVSRRLVGQLGEVTPDTFPCARVERVLLFLTQNDDAVDERSRRMRCAGIEREVLPQPSPWLEDASVWTGPVPAQAVRRITQWLA